MASGNPYIPSRQRGMVYAKDEQGNFVCEKLLDGLGDFRHDGALYTVVRVLWLWGGGGFPASVVVRKYA